MLITENELKLVNDTVAAERQVAIQKGLAWTAYRPFVSSGERIGAMRCGRCKNPSSYVSYGVDFLGRTALCNSCIGARRIMSSFI